MTCFPENLQVPALGSADLQDLRNDLARKVADARSSGTAEQTAQPVLATLTHTTNRATTYGSSGSPRVDLFFKYKGTGVLEGQMEQLLQQVHSLSLCCAGSYLLCLVGAKTTFATFRLGKRIQQTPLD